MKEHPEMEMARPIQAFSERVTSLFAQFAAAWHFLKERHSDSTC